MKSKNIKLLLLIKLLEELLFFLPIYALYLEESLFSLANVGFILALESVAKSILEIPTGALSDIYGRKNILIYANFIYLIALLFLLKGGSLIMFAMYAILHAFSSSLASGTDQALVYDTLLEENKEDQYPDKIGKLFAIRQFGAASGSLIGGFLAMYSYTHTIVWSLIPSLLAFILCFFLREPKLHKPVKKNINLHIKDSLIEVVNKKPLFLIVILSSVLWGLGEPLYYYTSIFFEARQIDVQAMGILFAGAFGLSSLGHYFSAAVMRKISWQKLLILCLIISPLVDLFSTVTFGYLAGILAIMPGLFFGVRNVIISTQTNALISHANRATILSISKSVDMVLITLGTVFVGYLADNLNITRVFQIFLSLDLVIPLIIALLYLKFISKIPNS